MNHTGVTRGCQEKISVEGVMPIIAGIGPRIAERLLAKGYRRADGRPDVRRFCLDLRYQPAVFYEWISGRSTPTKEVYRLCTDLEVTIEWLLHGVGKVPKPRRSPAIAGGSDQESPKGQPPRRIMLSAGGRLPLPAGHSLSLAAYRLAA